jgi:hypothetical protein
LALLSHQEIDPKKFRGRTGNFGVKTIQEVDRFDRLVVQPDGSPKGLWLTLASSHFRNIASAEVNRDLANPLFKQDVVQKLGPR